MAPPHACRRQKVERMSSTHHTLTPQRWLILICVMVGAAVGDFLLARGMQQVGVVDVHHLGTLFTAIGNPWVIGGILVLLGFMACNITALSWADVSFVYPATAFGNVITALLSKFFLHEDISKSRWLGISLIVVGVGFVAQGPSRTEHAEETP